MKKIIGAFVLVTVAASSLLAWDVNADKNERDKILKRWQFPTTWTQVPQSKDQTSTPAPTQQMQQPQNPVSTQSPSEPPKSQAEKSEDVIVMFTKDACPYCQYMKPIMKEVEGMFGNAITFIYADIEKHPQYPSDYGFSTVPHIAYFKNGKQVAYHGSGDKTVTVEQVKEKIRSLGMGETK